MSVMQWKYLHGTAELVRKSIAILPNLEKILKLNRRICGDAPNQQIIPTDFTTTCYYSVSLRMSDGFVNTWWTSEAAIKLSLLCHVDFFNQMGKRWNMEISHKGLFQFPVIFQCTKIPTVVAKWKRNHLNYFLNHCCCHRQALDWVLSLNTLQSFITWLKSFNFWNLHNLHTSCVTMRLCASIRLPELKKNTNIMKQLSTTGAYVPLVSDVGLI